MGYQTATTFDNYNDPTIFFESVSTSFGSAVPSLSPAYARNPAIGTYPNQGISVPGLSGVRKNLKSNQNKLITFMSIGIPNYFGGNSLVLPWFDNGTVQCYVAIATTGQISICRQVQTYGQTVLAASALGLISPYAANKPNHGLEVAITFHSSAGSVQAWLDGKEIIPLTTGLNTIVTANAYANQVGIGLSGSGLSQGQGIYSDYLRVWDTTGSYQNSPVMLDVGKLTKLGIGPGDLTQWTPNGAPTNWQASKQNPPNSGIYNSSNGNLYDSYNMGSAGLLVAPTMVVATSYCEKDDGATRALEIGVRSAGVNGLSAPFTMASSYGFVDYCVSVDPATGSPPSSAAADAFQHLKYEST